MVWIWIIAGCLFIVGSISWILPSPIERRQAACRMEATQLGLNIKVIQPTDWVRERLNTVDLVQYILRTNRHAGSLALWRVVGRNESWVSPPEANSWDLLNTSFRSYLDDLPECIVGIGARDGGVWLIFNDGQTDLAPTEIKYLLESMVDGLIKNTKLQN